MNFQGLKFHFSAAVLMSLVGCASATPVSTNTAAITEAPLEKISESTAAASTEIVTELPPKTVDNTYLICKASKRRFHYDWRPSSLNAGQEMIDQNNIRYEFRSANRPAGTRGENLKVGECGWATEALANQSANKKNRRSQVMFKKLSDEATQTFYKMKTGKVFKVPVRQTKNGLVAAPGGVSVIR